MHDAHLNELVLLSHKQTGCTVTLLSNTFQFTNIVVCRQVVKQLYLRSVLISSQDTLLSKKVIVTYKLLTISLQPPFTFLLGDLSYLCPEKRPSAPVVRCNSLLPSCGLLAHQAGLLFYFLALSL
jgi:hypothetical protein